MNILEPLRRCGVDSEVVSLFGSEALADDIEQLGLKIHFLKLRPRWDPRGITRIARISEDFGADVMHSHLASSTLLAGSSALFAPRPRRVAYHVNLFYDTARAKSLRHRLLKPLLRSVARRWIDVNVAVSAETAIHYRQHLGVPIAAVIPLSVPSSLVVGRDSADQRIGRSLITAARFVPEKGHRYLVDAIKLLVDRGFQPTVLFVGDGPLQENIESQIRRLGLEQTIEVRSSVPHADLLGLVRLASAVVMPSTQEGLPVAALEAMALGKPLIASSVGGLPSLVDAGQNGLLVPPADAAALADAIERILTDPNEGKRLGRAAAERVAATYTSEVVAAEWARLYRHLTSAGVGSRGA